jgi:hypothetical protein
MRFFTTSIAIVFAVLALTACTGKSSSSSDQSNATATTGAEATTAAADATTSPSAAGDIPSYPGATTQASGSSSNMMSGSASGTVMTTSDSFDTVYAWYQKNMPAGSEKAHMTSPVPSAVFTIGEPGKGQTSLTITTSAGKTMITVAHVKM